MKWTEGFFWALLFGVAGLADYFFGTVPSVSLALAPFVIPLAIGGGLAAGGIAGSVLGKKKVSPIDISPFLSTIRAAEERQRGIASGLRGQLTPLGVQFQTGVGAAADTAQQAARERAQQFLSEIAGPTSEIAQTQRAQARQSILGNIPEAQRAVRESAAATGGLQRGAAVSALAEVPRQAVSDLAQVEQGISLQELGVKQQALQSVFNLDEQLIQDRLGIDRDTLGAIFQSGREDLIREATSLLGISEQSTSDILDALGIQATGQQAAQSAEAAQRQALFNALIQAGGTVAGAGFGAGGGSPGGTAPPATTGMGLNLRSPYQPRRF